MRHMKKTAILAIAALAVNSAFGQMAYRILAVNTNTGVANYSANIYFPGGLSGPDATFPTNFMTLQQGQAMTAGLATATSYYLTNTVVVSNSLDFAITGLAANNVKVRYLAMYLSATNEAATSKRAVFGIYGRSDRLCDSAVYLDTNQLYWASPSTSAQAAGATTGTVSDASGVVLYDRYAVGGASTWDFLTATNANATTIFYGCTNKYSTVGNANTKISHVNYLTPIFYDDDSAQSSMWCRLVWTTGYTGTVTVVTRYSK